MESCTSEVVAALEAKLQLAVQTVREQQDQVEEGEVPRKIQKESMKEHMTLDTHATGAKLSTPIQPTGRTSTPEAAKRRKGEENSSEVESPLGARLVPTQQAKWSEFTSSTSG